MEYLYIICIGLLIFFSFSLLTKKNKPLSEQIFSFWILLLLVTVLSFLLYVQGKARNHPLFITLICDSHLLHGAILYLYVRAFTNPSFRLHTRHMIHLIPMFIQISAKLYLNYVLDEMHCYQEGGCVEEDNVFVTFTYLYKYLVLGAYILATWKVVNSYKKKAFTPRDQMRYNWVRQIALGVTFLYFGILIIQIGRYAFPILFWERMLLGNTLTTLFIYIFLYLGNSYAYIFVSPSRSRFKNLSESFNNNACKQAAPPNEIENIFGRIEDYMKKERPFTTPQLTLKELSDLTGISALAISQAVNKMTGSSLTDYINTYRIDLLKEKLKDPENKNYKIMAMAEECGFVSKATLLRIFRQQTGTTPSEYQKNHSSYS